MGTHILDCIFNNSDIKPEPTEFANLIPISQPCFRYSHVDIDEKRNSGIGVMVKKEEYASLPTGEIKLDGVGATQNISNTGITCDDIKIKLFLTNDDLSNILCSNNEFGEESTLGLKSFGNSIDLQMRNTELKGDIHANKCTTKDIILNHVTAPGIHKYKCTICSRNFKTSKVILKHMHMHSKEKTQLGEISTLQRKEYTNDTERNYKCQICNKSVKTKQSLSNHVKIHTGEKNYRCEICMKCFTAKSSLTIHMRIHNDERNYKCDICHKCFIRKDQLANHVKTHTGERNYKCEICTKYFTEKSNLSAHMKIHNGEKNYMCEICTNCFRAKGDLLKHMKRHTGERRYKCDICNKCFTANGDLLKHMRIHTGEKNYKCDICNKCFTAKCSLSIHMKIHTGERNYKCEICNKCFIRKGDLSKHMRIHTGERNFKCEICTKCFTTKSNLSSHMIIHTGERSYECEICSKCFKTKKNLLSHVKVHTGKRNVFLEYKKMHTDENNGIGKIENGLIKEETIKEEKFDLDNDTREKLQAINDSHINGTMMEEKPKSTDIFDLLQTFTSEIIIKEEENIMTTT